MPLPSCRPYFNETGSNCPSILSRTKQAELLDLAVKSSQVWELGVALQPSKCLGGSRACLHFAMHVLAAASAVNSDFA
jgi:hypothetical protein